jgi:hypothetical protein
MLERGDRVKRLAIKFEEVNRDEVVEILGEERWRYLTAPLLNQMFEDPSFSVTRGMMLSMLWELWNEPWEAKSLSEPYAYDDYEILISINVLQAWGTEYGLITGEEIASIKDKGQKVDLLDPKNKYLTQSKLYSKAEEWKRLDKTVGLVHGAFDPQHMGHAQLFGVTWQYCDVLLVGFDPNWLLKERKGADRPRFPQLAWRMWEVASLPQVEGVFVLPIKEAKGDEFSELYDRLGVKVLGTTEDNPYKDQYVKHMDRVDGYVAVVSPPKWSSTKLMESLSNMELKRRMLMNVDNYQSYANRIEQKALKSGFLQDYTDRTNTKPTVT